MLNLGLHRAAFAPVLLVVLVAAFALVERPRPIGTTVAPDAFDARAARTTLGELAAVAPDGLPARVRADLRAAGFATRAPADDDGQRVIAERAGRDPRRIVVVAGVGDDRPTRAGLTGTAALVELARLFEGRATRRTLTFAWFRDGERGASAVDALARAFAGGPVDAVLVLGDLGGAPVRRPVVVPWAESGGAAPLRLRRTVEAAVREETDLDPGAPRALAQFLRLAAPVTLGAQGPFGGEGLPAVLLTTAGERGTAERPDAAVDAGRLEAFGRAALRSITALDNGPDVPPGPTEQLVVARQVLPLGVVRVLAAALLFPAVLVAVDGLARVRRRREPVGPGFAWVATAALPFLLAAVLARLLGLTGLLPAPPGPADPRGVEVEAAGLVAVGLAVVLGGLLRPVAARALGAEPERIGLTGPDPRPGAPCAVALLLAALAVLVWMVNPFTALLLAPAVHLWLLAAAPEVRSRAVAVGLVILGAVPLVVLAAFYASVLALGPVELGWLGVLLLSGGTAGPLGVVTFSLLLGCGLAALLIALRKRPEAPSPVGPPVRVGRGPSRPLAVLEPVSSR